MSPVRVSLADLKNGKCDGRLLEAFGPESLGVLIIDGLDANFAHLRQSVLEKSRALANLPVSELNKLEVPESKWVIGWSRGRETLENGKPDKNKGSFYVNCNFVRDPSNEGPDQTTVENFPDLKAYIHSNVWPEESVLPGLKHDLKELIAYMVGVTSTVAEACDRAVCDQLVGLEKSLKRIVDESDCHKARLLHYYVPEDAKEPWCGDHLDHSCLTALTSALWGPGKVTDTGDAGLWIRLRTGEPVRVDIPEDCIAIQTGSCLEQLTEGRFKAVPHKVTGNSAFWRSTLAVFCQPRLGDRVGDENFATFATETINRFNAQI